MARVVRLAGAFADLAVPAPEAVDLVAVDVGAVVFAAVFGAAFGEALAAVFVAVSAAGSAAVDFAVDFAADGLAADFAAADFAVVDLAADLGAALLAADFAAVFGAASAPVVPALARVREERAGAASADTVPVRGDRRGALVAPLAASLLFPIWSRNAAPGRNDGTIVSGTGTVSPVRGLRATRAARRRGSNTPNPVSVTEEPDPTVSTITSTSPSTAAAAVRRSPIREVRASTN